MNLVVLTGAGISAESGIATFRDAGGLWEGHNIEDVATFEGFRRQPQLVQQFYNQRRAQLSQVSPNRAHLALAQLEQQWSGPFLLVTQNVDDLHERAGSRQLIHMHGQLDQARCLHCEHVQGQTGDISADVVCDRCGGPLRPHIVWFGEIPLAMEQIEHALLQADVFVAIGTSGAVYPAAGFVRLTRAPHRIEINLESTGTSSFNHHITGPASRSVEAFVAQLRGGAFGPI